MPFYKLEIQKLMVDRLHIHASQEVNGSQSLNGKDMITWMMNQNDKITIMHFSTLWWEWETKH